MRLWNRLAIRTKLIITFGAAILISILCIVGSIAAIAGLFFATDLSNLSSTIAINNQVDAGAALIAKQLAAGESLKTVDYTSIMADGMRRLMITDLEGGVVWDSLNERKAIAVSDVIPLLGSVQAIQGMHTLASPIIFEGGVVGLFIAELDTPLFSGIMESGSGIELWVPWIIVFGFLVSIVASLVLFWFFGQHLVQPTRELSQFVQTLAQGNLGERLMFGSRQDELGRLAMDVNTMAEELATAQRKMHQAEQGKRYLIAGASHDLRTPLTSILVHTEALLHDVAENPKQSLETIYERGLHLQELLDDIFELSTLQSEPKEWEFAPIDLAELVRQAIIGFWPQLEEEEILADIQVPDYALWVQGTAGKLRRVMDNLLSNALKYGKDGKWLGVKVSAHRGRYRVEVEDKGRGISLKEQEIVFEPFVRLETATRGSSGKSRGLGLAIAKEIVERHGGRIGVEQLSPSGVRFWFELPQSRPES